MKLFNTLKWSLLGALLALPLSAGDYDDLLKAVKQAWPERTSVGVICNVDANQLTLMDLGDAAKTQNLSLLIMNVRKPQELKGTVVALMGKNPGMLLILDEDEFLGAKSREVGRVINQFTARKIPTVAISEEPIKLGAILAVGPATKGKLLTNAKVAERLGLPLPDEVPGIQVETPK